MTRINDRDDSVLVNKPEAKVIGIYQKNELSSTLELQVNIRARS